MPDDELMGLGESIRYVMDAEYERGRRAGRQEILDAYRECIEDLEECALALSSDYSGPKDKTYLALAITKHRNALSQQAGV